MGFEEAAVDIVYVASGEDVWRGGCHGGGPGNRAGGEGRGGEVGGGIDVHSVAAAADLVGVPGAGHGAACREALVHVKGVAAEALIGVLDTEVGVRTGIAVVAVVGAVFHAGDAEVVRPVNGAGAGEVGVAVLVDVGAGLLDDCGAGWWG